MTSLEPAQASTPVQLQDVIAAEHYLSSQLAASVILAVSFALMVLIALAVSLKWTRFALFLLGLYGILTFWIPSPVTYFLSPVITLIGVAGFLIHQGPLRR